MNDGMIGAMNDAMNGAKTLDVYIERDWRAVYEAIWRPQVFPTWAAGLSNSGLIEQGDRWTADSPAGPVTIRFTCHNPYGVMDHYVELPDGHVVYVPLRVVQKGAGAHVSLILFRQPGMTDAKFESDADMVRQDLAALKKLF
jgi:hypothetical protein